MPRATRLVTRPGTAPTSRPSLAACSAVISEPEGCAASTTTVIVPSAAMIRLRFGKQPGPGTVPGGISETTAPDAR